MVDADLVPPADDLAANERVAALLAGPLAWHEVEHVGETTSTHDLALARMRAGAQPGLVVVADRQTAGRGRRGRSWQDLPSPDASLLLTAVAPAPPVHPTLVPLAAGLAVADALRRAGATPWLKWPNDVLLDGKKTAGILVEQHRLQVGDVLLIGVGINVDWRGVERDGEREGWTSVAEHTDTGIDRGDLLADLLRGLAAWLHSVPADPLRLLVAYRDACATLGLPVRVELPDGSSIEGDASDLDREGRLVVDTAERVVAVDAGDVVHLRPRS